MIAITAKWYVKPEYASEFPALTREFTDACRAEAGCLWFEWGRSTEDATVYYLTEAYADADAGKAHVKSDHFAKAMSTFGQYLSRRPQIVSVEARQKGWDELGELEMDD